MIQACRDKTLSAGLDGRVDFFTGRLQDYPASAPFGAAASIFVAHFIKGRDEKLAYFKSIAANLQVGGMFILADLFGDKQSTSFAPLLDAWLRHYASHGVAADTLAKDRAHVARDIDYRPESELIALLVEAGFAPPVRFYQALLFGGWATVRAA
jgi:tRNA (cmo5U34)-methyltransferase